MRVNGVPNGPVVVTGAAPIVGSFGSLGPTVLAVAGGATGPGKALSIGPGDARLGAGGSAMPVAVLVPSLPESGSGNIVVPPVPVVDAVPAEGGAGHDDGASGRRSLLKIGLEPPAGLALNGVAAGGGKRGTSFSLTEGPVPVVVGIGGVLLSEPAARSAPPRVPEPQLSEEPGRPRFGSASELVALVSKRLSGPSGGTLCNPGD